MPLAEQVLSSSKASSVLSTYLVFPGSYCACHAFFYDVATKSEAVCVSGALRSLVGLPRVAIRRCSSLAWRVRARVCSASTSWRPGLRWRSSAALCAWSLTWRWRSCSSAASPPSGTTSARAPAAAPASRQQLLASATRHW